MATRDERGRFKAGNKASTGRKSVADELPYVDQLKQQITAEQFGNIISKLVEQSSRGNLDATKILLPYLLGNPVSKTELTGANNNPFELVITYANKAKASD